LEKSNMPYPILDKKKKTVKTKINRRTGVQVKQKNNIKATRGASSHKRVGSGGTRFGKNAEVEKG